MNNKELISEFQSVVESKILVNKIHQIFNVLELRRKKTFLLIDFLKDLKV